MEIRPDQDVLWLDVSVHDVVGVTVEKTFHDLSCVEHAKSLIQLTYHTDQNNKRDLPFESINYVKVPYLQCSNTK